MTVSKKIHAPRRRALASAVCVVLASTAAGTAGPASAAHARRHHAHTQLERRGVGVPAPAARRASRHAWGGWIGSWVTADGQTVYHLDPDKHSGRARFRKPVRTAQLHYGARAVDPAKQAQAAWILARYGAVQVQAQAAAVELAVDALLRGGKFALAGKVTKKRLARLDGPTRGNLLRLAGQMISAAQQQLGPYTVHLSKAGAASSSAVPVTVSVTSATGAPLARAPISVRTSGGVTLSGATGSTGAPVSFSVPLASGPVTQIAATAGVPDNALQVRNPTRHRLSRAAVAGATTPTGTAATATRPTSWSLTWQQYTQTAPASDTRTYQTRYTGTWQDSWTCKIPKGSTYCTDPAGDACSQSVPLNSGTWDETYVPPSGYRAGNTCVWRTYTQTGSYVVQTGGTYTPAQYGWVPAAATYGDPDQAAAAYGTCQRNTSSQRSCVLSDNSSWSSQ